MLAEDTTQFHTNSELQIIKGYLFSGYSLTTIFYHSPLHEKEAESESSTWKQEPETRE